MKKKWVLSSLIIMLASFVSAYSYVDFRSAASDIVRWIIDIFSPFFEALLGATSYDANFFAKILFLILVFVVIYSILHTKIKPFKDNKVSSAIIALAFSLLGARYISEFAFFSFILLPTQMLAIGLVNGLILLIVFYFIQSNEDKNARRIMWIVFLAALFAVWIDRIGELGKANWVYGIIFVLGVLALIFDAYIHDYSRIKDFMDKERNRRIVNLQTRLQHIGETRSTHADRERDQIERDLRRLGASVN